MLLFSYAAISYCNCKNCTKLPTVRYSLIITNLAVFYLSSLTKGRHKRESKNKKQNGLAHLRFLVCVTPKQIKHCLIRESSF